MGGRGVQEEEVVELPEEVQVQGSRGSAGFQLEEQSADLWC